jgi:DNA polymerase
MLASLDVARGRGVYIANIVKCRPTDVSGNDRAPSAEEAASCRPFLKRQIALLQPELVLALGKTAAVSLLAANPETAVSSLRGSVRAISASYAGEREIPMVVSYHPAYLLRKPQDKARAWADLCLARSRLQARGAK